MTELLLADLGRVRPEGRWTLWGDPGRLAPYAWPGTSLSPSAHDPRRFFGQRDAASLPGADVVVFLQQIRPLRRVPAVTFVHDTIPLRYSSPALAAAKRTYLRLVARLSDEIVTVSEHARVCVVRDLGVDRARVSVARLGTDAARAAGIAALRETLPQRDRVLFVGRFARHKNLPRLYRAFAGSAFAAGGGELLLVGGTSNEVAREGAAAAAAGARILVHGTCSEHELAELYATSRALVAPALEEGFGLPAHEAVAAGLPVAASDTGAQGDLPSDAVVLFDPTDEEAITRAIDAAVARPAGPARDLGPVELASVVTAAVERVLARRAGRRRRRAL